MRIIVGMLAFIIGCTSVALCARFGYGQAVTEIDRWIGTVVFGGISAVGMVFDGLAVNLWMRGARKGAVFIGALGTMAFVLIFATSLGGIASRAEQIETTRRAAADARKADEHEVARLETAINALGKLVYADETTVEAANLVAKLATGRRKAECGENNERRGRLCQERESDEARATEALAASNANKVTIDTAKEYEAKLQVVRARLRTPGGLTSADPLGSVLALIFGSAVEVVTAKMKAAIALGFDLGLVGLMVGFELLGHVPTAQRYPATIVPSATTYGARAVRERVGAVFRGLSIRLRLRANESKSAVNKSAMQVDGFPARPQLVASRNGLPFGAVGPLCNEALQRQPGSRVEMGSLYDDYARRCSANVRRPYPRDDFVGRIEEFCSKVGIRITKAGTKLFLLDVELADAGARMASS